MHFQVRTDNHIKNSEALADRVRAEVDGALAHGMDDRIRRVEVYFQDLNANKGGIDIRCSIEVSIAGHQPVAVAAESASLDDAVTAAIDKMLRVLEHTLGRIEDRLGRVSMSGEET